MNSLSIVIPAYREPFLNNTIESLLKNTVGDFEIIPVIDGYDSGKIIEDSRVKPIILERNTGMRNAINSGISSSSGKFIMKCDSHCSFAYGFNKVLTDSCEDNWLIIPRRYSLSVGDWERDMRRAPRDYHYLTFPDPKNTHYGNSMQNADWHSMDKRRSDNKYNIDDTMSFQGSCWVANRRYFLDRVGVLDDSPEAYGTFIQEYLEIGMKYWLGGGEIKINKNTWYSHLSKRKHHYLSGMFSRNYKKDKQSIKSYNWATNHWINDKEANTIHSFEWFIDRFWPIPSWPKNWKELYIRSTY
jgi:glycosyltransferase involved in cell wall biosynthesis